MTSQLFAKKSVLDICCGPGGLGTGFEEYFNVCWAVDINKDACETYSANHIDAKVECKDVRDLTYVKKDVECIAGAIGGTPCQDFTVLNKNRDSTSDRANLIYEMLRAAEEINPEFLLIENVASVPKEKKDEMIKGLMALDYNVVSKVTYASNYGGMRGSVQKRRRWILTACKSKHVWPEEIPSTRTAGEVLLTGNDLVEEMQRRQVTPNEETLKAVQEIPAGKWSAIPGQNYKVYYVVEEGKLFPAIVNPTKLRYIRPDRSGYLTRLELERAQGFPDDYQFAGTLSSWGQQLANAVPVEMGRAFAQAFAEAYA